MRKKDNMIEEIHVIRKKMWDESQSNLLTLAKNIEEKPDKSEFVYADTIDRSKKSDKKNSE
jgi:hypothetical protein